MDFVLLVVRVAFAVVAVQKKDGKLRKDLRFHSEDLFHHENYDLVTVNFRFQGLE